MSAAGDKQSGFETHHLGSGKRSRPAQARCPWRALEALDGVRRTWLCGVGIATLATLGGCGSSQPRPRSEAYLSAVFERIQVHEAALEQAEAELGRAMRCQERQSAGQAMEDQAARICALAEQARDPDAETRCKLAQRRARSGPDRMRRLPCERPRDD